MAVVDRATVNLRPIKMHAAIGRFVTRYDPAQPIVITADASNYGIGAVLSHRFDDGSEKAVIHAPRTLTQAENNYGQVEKEALGLVFAIQRFHKFLFGRHFTLLTDHEPLLSIFGSKKGIPVHSANRLQRWAITLLGYDFDIQYRRTSEFGQAVCLVSSVQRPGLRETQLWQLCK